MNTFAYMGRLLAGLVVASGMLLSVPALADERKTPEISLKKSADCDLDLSGYASEGHGGAKAFVAREVKKTPAPSIPAAKKSHARISARAGLIFTAAAK